MNDEQRIKGRLTDLAEKAYRQNVYTYSNFLSAAELALLDELQKDISYISYTCFGGNALCERQIVGFGGEEEFGYPGHFPIAVVKVSPLLEKFGEELNHRDFLGALMHLGIERDMVGDILVKEKTAYIFCMESIADYICKELTRVRHTNVKGEITDIHIPELKPALADEEFPVASLRLDGILAALLKCSRNEALSLFADKRVTLNGRVTGRNSITLKEGDVFSVRGHGKFIFAGSGGSTRKGKIYVHIRRYI
ncbi:MAG: YlmH/Sll1252 family protein [Bacteroidales bacterium]|nr:YlmH/Sll1252 family protein [Clostridium sp.]MCM1203728.1 YlmH/Sll1252 family protein [Bacteroidales bacterium]